MSRRLKTKRFKTTRSLLLLSALTAALSTAPARSVHAAAYTYDTRQRTVNAGVLTVAGSVDPAPYIFYVFDQRADIKPVGWTFVNPIASTTVTPPIKSRWGYAANATLTPSMAGYWEVPLRDTSSDQLQQFDVLYLPATGIGFTPSDNEKLRRFVDGGGQLIVEYANTGGTPALFAGLNWTTASAPALTPPAAGTAFDLEPILTQSYLFAPSDLNLLATVIPPASDGVLSGTGDFGNWFSPVLSHPGGIAIAAAQLGAGQIIASTLSLGPVVSLSSLASFSTPLIPGPPPGPPPNPLTVPAIDLKLLSNMISWGDTHPTENKTSHQNSAGPSSASFAPAWSELVAGSTPPPGAAIWGNFVYVTDAAGVLHCFDAYPDEDLLGEGKSDNGIPDFAGGSSYDEIWKTSASLLGSNASAPTVATFNGTPCVFVEKANGSVIQFNSVTGVQIKTFPTSSTLAYPVGSIPNAPAPTYYEGRIYAGQADGTLLVYDLNASGSAAGGVSVPLQTGASPGEYVTASPAVGLLNSGSVNNSVVATVATNQNVYTVLLGGRNDPLVGYNVNGQLLGYNINRNTRYFLPNLFADLASNPVGTIFDTYGNGLGVVTNGQDPVFNNPTIGDYFANWDIDFIKSLAAGSNSTLSLHSVKDLSLQSTGNAQTVSAPAFDRNGDYYFTVNDGSFSYLMGIHDDIQSRNVRIKFRFRIPTLNDPSAKDNTGAQWNNVDADNVNYANLLGYQFVGAPVVDGQGNVYVAAQSVQNSVYTAAIFCFNGNQEPSSDAQFGFDTAQSNYFQYDEAAPAQMNSLVAVPTSNPVGVRFGQLSVGANHISVFNFGRVGKQIQASLSEPQPFIAQPNGNQGSVSAQTMEFHTNLSWYTTFVVNGPISGLTKAGNVLMLVDTPRGAPPAFNVLYKFPANPPVGSGKVVAALPINVPLGSGLASGGTGRYLNIGAVSAAPSAGGGAMIVNGAGGIAAFNQQLTLVADNNRILEVDADGNTVWSADATTRTLGSGAATQVSKVDFGHPTSLSQFAPNDYLVADTGNNRCVRFDRAGNVLWELTRFNDPNGLMAPGQPNTLSQPTSVEINTLADPLGNLTYTDGNGVAQLGSRRHYLVADSGNDRILEVTDYVDATGQNVLYKDASGNLFSTNPTGVYTPQDHILTWESHTADVAGRRYRYAGATYFSPALGKIAVAALVTNARIGDLSPTGQLSSAGADSRGGSIVVFNQPTISPAYNTITAATPNDLAKVLNTFSVAAGANAGSYQVRNPRFLRVFTAPQPAPASYTFLYADDNGAFDFTVTGNVLVSKGLAFTAKDYQAMSPAAPAIGIPTTIVLAGANTFPLRTYFVPTCVQRINSDNSLLPRYLITQSYGQSELGTALPGATPAPKIGGEIFEVDVDQTTASAPVSTSVGGFGPGATLSRPGATNPLTQPTYAIRTPQ